MQQIRLPKIMNKQQKRFVIFFLIYFFLVRFPTMLCTTFKKFHYKIIINKYSSNYKK
ncbi:hypothetical protein Pint_21424 [Pistacia integerrima]|uniref:Uncharacterized protein n=1 Tax=Pistacia integerrima TaxID=434235 RepID=A0ACC0X8W0_9ROSI|nr:hypothetical protein Pint_21424 [Pistacia integerrima]